MLYALAFILLLAGVGLLLTPTLRASDPASSRPNVVVIMTDDQDYPSLPVMRRLLNYPEGSWVNFPNFFRHVFRHFRIMRKFHSAGSASLGHGS